MMLLAVAGLIFASCGTKTQQATEIEEPKCEFTLMLDKWATFDELDEEGQIALVGEMKAFLNECKAKHEEKCASEKGEQAEEVCPEKAAKCAEFKAQWEEFENLELEVQKALIDQVLEHKAKCCKNKEVEETPEVE